MIRIYGHINKVNGKAYIGQTSTELEKRWGINGSRYLEKRKTGEYKHPKFANAIIKYGWDNFEHVLLESIDEQTKADEIERKYITKYNSILDGYNCISGGKSGGLFSEESKIKLSNSHLKENLNSLSIEKYRNAHLGKSFTKGKHYKKISISKQGDKNPMYGKEPWNKYSGRSVISIHPDTGIETYYPNVHEAAKAVGIKSIGNINKCCNGKRMYAAGFSWKWGSKIESKEYNGLVNAQEKRRLKVIGISLKDETTMEFSSLEEAAKFCGLKNPTTITAVIKGRQKSSAGYKWLLKE